MGDLDQGAEDEVVPPSQAEVMVHALEAKGLPYAYLLFEGEQHGFRKAENIVRSREAELSFYAQILGFEPGDGSNRYRSRTFDRSGLRRGGRGGRTCDRPPRLRGGASSRRSQAARPW